VHECYKQTTDGRTDDDESSRSLITRNSSGDEIANVNFLYDDIVLFVHALKTDWCINSVQIDAVC